MIEVYAVDPALFLNYITFKFISENFGYFEGRLLADFSKKKWGSDVLKLVYEHANDLCLSGIQLKQIEEWINNIAPDFTVKGNWKYDKKPEWIGNALLEQDKFHLILTAQNPKINKNNKIFLIDKFTSRKDNSLFYKDEIDIPKTIDGFRKASRTLLTYAKKRVIFFDPNLDINLSKRGFGQALQEFFQHIPRAIKDISYITVFDLSPKPGSSPIDGWEKYQQNALDGKIKNLNDFLPYYIPSGRSIEIKILDKHKELNSEIIMHNRYIMTDRAAILFGWGLDVMEGKMDDLSIMAPKNYQKRYRQMTALADEQLCTPPFRIYGQ